MPAPTSLPTASGSRISSIPQRKNFGSQSRWGLARNELNFSRAQSNLASDLVNALGESDPEFRAALLGDPGAQEAISTIFENLSEEAVAATAEAFSLLKDEVLVDVLSLLAGFL